MSQLSLIIKTELLTDLKGKAFWISTIVAPLVLIGFGIVVGFLMSDTTFTKLNNEIVSSNSDPSDLSPAQVTGMMVGMFLTFFLMIYGSMIFQKVKTEKCNRIMEILCTCVESRTLMLGKIIAVGLVGVTQLLVWSALIILAVTVGFMLFPFAIPWDLLTHPLLYKALAAMILYFIGGYVLFGSLYAACGAITDKDNENQIYMTVITFLLLGAFYIGQYAVDHGNAALSVACTFIPFTSPTVGTINTISGAVPMWQSLLSLALLYASALLSVAVAGKLYKASMMFKGKNFTPSDIITFIRTS